MQQRYARKCQVFLWDACVSYLLPLKKNDQMLITIRRKETWNENFKEHLTAKKIAYLIMRIGSIA